jgi:hypothetical protein
MHASAIAKDTKRGAIEVKAIGLRSDRYRYTHLLFTPSSDKPICDLREITPDLNGPSIATGPRMGQLHDGYCRGSWARPGVADMKGAGTALRRRVLTRGDGDLVSEVWHA